MPDVRLTGCRSRPLIGYLKSLGLLRIVANQVDGSARARWSDGAFALRSTLSEEELTAFLVDRYSPAPVVSPWNGGSGFHPKDRKEAILALEQTSAPRFGAYREAIGAVRGALERLEITDKPLPDEKRPLIRELRRVLPDSALPWLDAAVIVTGEKVSYPPLLGSGGNDGRYDFSNNYAQAVVECLMPSDPGRSVASLSAALHGGPAELQRKLSLGHLNRDASPNNSPYGEADSLGNPWDLLLAVEGTLLLVAGAARRHGAASGGTLVAPFTVRSTAAGYGSAVNGETGRAELWLPLWSGWASCSEIEVLIRESRAQVGRGLARRQASTGLDYAIAAGALGVARGVDAFERYAILERAGQSSLAVSAGRVAVSERRDGARAIQSIDRWLGNALRFAAEDACPRQIVIAVRKLERASFALASRGRANDACAALEAIGEVEHALARSRSAIASGRLQPLMRASAEPWIRAADDESEEFAVALSIASLHDGRPRSPALRDYLHGTRRAKPRGFAFDPDRRHAVEANSAVSLLAEIHARRHLDAAGTDSSSAEQHGDDVPTSAEMDHDERTRRGASSGLDFEAATWCKLRLAHRFAAGKLDDRRILRLVQGLALLDHAASRVTTPMPAGSADAVVPAFDLLALAWMGQRLDRLEPDRRALLKARRGMAARLASGATRHVLADCALRLRMAGLAPILTPADLMTNGAADRALGPRLGAALLLRIAPKDLERIALDVTSVDWKRANERTEEHA